MNPGAHHLSLTCHPATPCAVLATIEVEVSGTADGALLLRYRLRGDIDRLLLPAATPSRRRDGLWRHSCCEAFVALPGASAYLEFNFSPAGSWAAYAFSGYRQRAAADPSPAPAIACRRLADCLLVEATIPAPALPPLAVAPAFDLGLAAVAEAQNGASSYWALRHPAPRPDFHHRDAFALSFERTA